MRLSRNIELRGIFSAISIIPPPYRAQPTRMPPLRRHVGRFRPLLPPTILVGDLNSQRLLVARIQNARAIADG
ncbi:hypothetical protein EVAR_10579_1 [Eumeta japonica]|uniref:Uncharacterized protein n=1 Tax=Eumeta variegata TaxID=151549 RepID=A0A4C1U2E7_EUMVA|nr:hypothetical protein EVAR_10579_1 [Eumeta japonica]